MTDQWTENQSKDGDWSNLWKTNQDINWSTDKKPVKFGNDAVVTCSKRPPAQKQ